MNHRQPFPGSEGKQGRKHKNKNLSVSCRLRLLSSGCALLESYLGYATFVVAKRPWTQYPEIWFMSFHQDLPTGRSEVRYSPSFWCEDLEKQQNLCLVLDQGDNSRDGEKLSDLDIFEGRADRIC